MSIFDKLFKPKSGLSNEGFSGYAQDNMDSIMAREEGGFQPSIEDASGSYYEGSSDEMPSARDFAKSFDPTSGKDVTRMQGMLGLKEDGILGPKTLAALRGLQGEGVEGQGDSGYDSYGHSGKPTFGENMRDDEGMFQGGEQGRMFGRGRDKVGGLFSKASKWLNSDLK